MHEKSEGGTDNNAVPVDEKEHHDAAASKAEPVDGKVQTPPLSERERPAVEKVGGMKKESVKQTETTKQNAKSDVKMNEGHVQGRGKSAPPKKNSGPKQRTNNMVGTGASLLSKNMRGGKGDTGKELPPPHVILPVIWFFISSCNIPLHNSQHSCYRHSRK